MIMISKRLILSFGLAGFFILGLSFVEAASLILPNKPGTFAVMPARKELLLSAGQSQTIYLRVANYLGRETTFSIGLNDLSAQTYGREGYVVATATARYSLSDIVSLDREEFLLKNGEEIEVPIRISIPADWPPSSVAGLINLGPGLTKTSSANAQIKTSAGVLLLVRIKGQAVEKGQVEKFGLISGRLVMAGQPLKFQVAYKNSGNVYLNPYGLVTLKSGWGRPIATYHLDPWFVLPQSIRLREIDFKPHHWPSLYRAELDLNLGFNNQVISQSFYFLLIPNYWQWLIIILVIILLLRLSLRKRRHE